MSHFAENFVGEPISFSLFWVSTTFMLQRVKSRFSVEIFSSHGAEKFCRGTLLCFTDFLASKTFMEKKGGGVSGISVERFLSHFAEKFCRGTH